MEAEPSHSADGDRSETQEQQHVTAGSSFGSCPQPQQPSNPRPVHRALCRLQNRQPKRSDLLRLQQQAVAWQHTETPGPSGGSFFSPGSTSTSSHHSSPSTQGEHGPKSSSQSSQETKEGVSSPRKGEKKPPKPGKYVCTYCGRPCAKPSVLQKHIRSHTGERPYPCAPCGFSFKTKSNLYKHRKSHAHRIKAGLASSHDEPSLSGPDCSGVAEDAEEHTEGESTESEDETGQHKKSSHETLARQKNVGKELQGGSVESQRPDDTQAVKQRLALRLSERKRGPMASPDDPPSSLSTSSSLGPGSKGSTESGYCSGSGSTDLSHVSPPSASAKSYAEIILGKYGRLGGQQRSPHPHHSQSPLSPLSGTEDKSISFAVPKTQVIEHITKLITINEAVVDTSEIDSVKPRRSSLSRKSSFESPKMTASKDPYTFDPKGEAPGPSGLRHLQNPETDPPITPVLSAVPLLRSHSMPSTTSQLESSSSGIRSNRGYRLCQSFDEQQAMTTEINIGHTHRMLRRQPAIEVPLGSELMPEETPPNSSSSTTGTDTSRYPEQQAPHSTLNTFECKVCRRSFQHLQNYTAHKGVCKAQQTLEQESSGTSKTCREDRPPMMMHYKFRAMAMAVRKRRKEESIEEDLPSPGSGTMSGSSTSIIAAAGPPGHSQALSGGTVQVEPEQQQHRDRKGVSVIQHTSSFETQETLSMESEETNVKEVHQAQPPLPKPSPSTSRLIRQPNIQVPEILVTVEPDADMPSMSPPVTSCSSKEADRVEEFQWPQRSQTLAQLPAEKLPPKKKRLRLAEAAQSSGESSFESVSLPRSPSQESSMSHTSSLSASFEDATRSEPAVWGSSSQSTQMLTVPSTCQQQSQSHKEMRRSASEQAPQKVEQVSDTRSKSFDLGSLSSQQSASAWKERRKCLLVKHATLGEPEQEEGGSISQLSRVESPKPGPSHSVQPLFYSNAHLNLKNTGNVLQLLQPQILPRNMIPSHESIQQTIPPAPLSQLLPVTTVSQFINRTFLHSQTVQPLQVHPMQIQMAEQIGIPFHQLPALVPVQFPYSVSQSLYSPATPLHSAQIISSLSTEGSASYPYPGPLISTCGAQFTPAVSLVVPVRLHTHIPTYTRAMYTTLSQILTSACPQDPILCKTMTIMDKVERRMLQRSYLKVPSPDIRIHHPEELQSSSIEEYGPLGAGGSKRMLSPAASLELSTEAQRHQKRVKEEADGEIHKSEVEVEDFDNKVHKEGDCKTGGEQLEDVGKKKEMLEVTPVKEEGELNQRHRELNKEEKLGEESVARNQKEKVPLEKKTERANTHSYPSLHTSTSVIWCYLNYVKPNPTAQRDPRNSVYSTWSVSGHNPNLPGVSTKVALSLLCSKQKYSSETYTIATAPNPAKIENTPASSRTPRMSEVHPITASSTDVTDHQHEKEEDKETRDEEGPSTSKQCETSHVRIFEGGYKSNEEYIYVRGRGRGKYICGECGIRCKKPSMLKKHIRTHTDVRPYICKHCNFAFKTKGNLTKHMKSKAHGKKCQAMGVSEPSADEPESEETAGSDEHACCSEEQEEHQFSNVEESEDDDDDDENEEEEEESHDDPPSSCSSDTLTSTAGRSKCSGISQQCTPEPEPAGLSPSLDVSQRGAWHSRRATSPGSMRALFSRRSWKASPRAFSPSSESCSPSHSLSPRLELSPTVHGLSPRTDLPSPIRQVSPSPDRGPSPIRPASPLHPILPDCYGLSHASKPSMQVGVQQRTLGCLHWEHRGAKGNHMKVDKSGSAGDVWSSSETEFPPVLRLSTCESYPGHRAADNIFSHLPMHSQHANVPYLMIPIGGIQMVRARPRSNPSTPLSPMSPSSEGPSPARFDSFWGGTPGPHSSQTPGSKWSTDSQAAEGSQSGRCTSAQIMCSKLELETTDSKQYGSSRSSAHTCRRATESSERHFEDVCEETSFSLTAPASMGLSEQPPEDEGRATADAAGEDQST
ncbi:transcription factor HIVEP3 isoform X1 [Corythoichthys intestinalis]|uniref:transcription factor HIVEP3 isoform X1 n=1 Tax=Corythoichthys intestinalis TaxID=161448 RepID=UPI0025A5FAD4|nr:transcription factor HIVEP3 isoform X1 [Corythoichthys intestinalis]XP_057689545.1 transcription factor HIVEP3 isoform X1 [Corythoichthys intestinalis]